MNISEKLECGNYVIVIRSHFSLGYIIFQEHPSLRPNAPLLFLFQKEIYAIMLSQVWREIT